MFSYSDAEKVSQGRGISFDDALQIDDDLMLILDEAARVINHSCDPNAGIKNRNDLYAIKDIHIGDEITYDYSTTASPNETWTMKCRCGAKNCRLLIGNVLTIPSITLKRYYQLGTLPDFIKRQFNKIMRLSSSDIK